MTPVSRYVREAVRRYRLAVVALLAIVTAQILVSLALPWPLKIVIDNVLGGVPPGYLPESLANWLASANKTLPLAVLAAAFLFLRSFNQVGQLARHYIMARIGALMRIDIATELLAKLQTLDPTFYGRERVGDMTQRLIEDTRFTGEIVGQVVVPGLTSLVTLVAMLAILASLSPTLALIALAASLPIPFLVLHFRPRITERHYRQQESFGDLMAETEQSLTSIQVIQAFNREQDGVRRFRNRSARALHAVLHATRAQLSFDLAIGVCQAFGTGLALIAGGFLALRGEITVGTLLVALAYLASVFGPVGAMASVATAYGAATGKGRRVTEILGLVPKVQERSDAKVLPPGKPGNGRRIQFENVGFCYTGQDRVLDGLNFEIAAGETLALVGKTGAGKSTIAGLIVRLMDPDQGRILIDGHDLRDLQLDNLRQNMAVVLQDPVLLPISVAENIGLGDPQADRDRITAAARAAMAHDFIEALPEGYDTVLQERGAGLSGGQKQRIAIARALLRDTPVLLLDEPSSALDVETETALFDTLTKVRRSRTVLLIAHRPATLRVADRVLELRDGRVIERPDLPHRKDRSASA
ncbi:ABC transporter ATP-binding protein [Tropicimonas aquimaris]|uniref:ABC transporter ATP-binding protein n=1 Tax=Tropicimonas aquimaris TaxID=914152 RepID=A0ABW3IQB4_9RHOB